MEQMTLFGVDMDRGENTILTNKQTNKQTNGYRVVHCFFEQSGTFKNEFRKLGVDAYDYDILNDFGETDFVIDLFQEIEKAYEEKESIFDEITNEDLILAFFPCVRFENQCMLMFRGQQRQIKDWSIREKMKYDMKLLSETKHNYDIVNKLFIVCIDRGLKLVMENPYSEEHFLRRYWCFEPKVIDKDRRNDGDYYAKPTQYWFLNLEPKCNFLLEPIEYNDLNEKDAIRRLNSSMYPKEWGNVSQRVARSMIHPTYANRFIRRYLLNDIQSSNL